MRGNLKVRTVGVTVAGSNPWEVENAHFHVTQLHLNFIEFNLLKNILVMKL